jgi:hypothetical protein
MSGFSLDRLKDVSLAVSGIVCDCRVWTSPKHRRTGGLIAFRGEYRTGSAGKPDAMWIGWKLNEFQEPARPDGLVVDCRELVYTWGDDLTLRPHFRLLPESFPFRLVIRPDQQEAFAFVESRELHRFDLTSALAEIDDSLQNAK